MKLIRPSYEIISPKEIDGKEILKEIEKAARTCYKSEDKITDDSAEKLVKQLVLRGHEAMLEFGPSIAVKFICDRGVSHELVRHRIASFAQESTRYCNYGKEEHISFIIPEWIDNEQIEKVLKLNESNYFEVLETTVEWYAIMSSSESSYRMLLKHGWTPQQARSVLPNSLKTEINVSANIREWRHILKLRTSSQAHPQMRELMRPLLEELKSRIPILFDDIIY